MPLDLYPTMSIHACTCSYLSCACFVRLAYLSKNREVKYVRGGKGGTIKLSIEKKTNMKFRSIDIRDIGRWKRMHKHSGNNVIFVFGSYSMAPYAFPN